MDKGATEALLKAPGSGDGTFLVSKHKIGSHCLSVLHQGKITRHSVARETKDIATRKTWTVGSQKPPQRAGATTNLDDAITWLTDRGRCKLAKWPAPLLYPVPVPPTNQVQVPRQPAQAKAPAPAKHAAPPAGPPKKECSQCKKLFPANKGAIDTDGDGDGPATRAGKTSRSAHRYTACEQNIRLA